MAKNQSRAWSDFVAATTARAIGTTANDDQEQGSTAVIAKRLRRESETDQELLGLVALAEGKGKPGVAYGLLHEFVADRVAGLVPREPLMDFLAICVSRLLDDHADAFGIRQKPEGKAFEERLLIWALVELARRNGDSLNKAVDHAAQRLNLSERQIWRELNNREGEISDLLQGGGNGETPRLGYYSVENLEKIIQALTPNDSS